MQPFWMVYGDGQRAPAYKHHEKDSAVAEARRLADVNPGIAFYVLQVIGRAEKVSVSYTEISDDFAGF